MHMVQRKCISSYHSSFLIVMICRFFYKDKKIGDEICGMNILKQKTK